MSTTTPSFTTLRAASMLAALLCVNCTELETPDEAASQSAADDLDLPPLPDLSPAELAALQAEQTVASLTVPHAGRVEIVRSAAPDAAEFAYLAVGGALTTDVLRQLVTDQAATPAEVFLALAEPGQTLPEALLADHQARAEDDPTLDPTPRQLAFTTPRTFETVTNECLGSGSSYKSFANWLTDWEDRFEFINFRQPNMGSAQNVANGTTAYGVASDLFGRVLSACNASYNDIGVVYWYLSYIPGPTFPYTYVAGATVNRYKAVHFFSEGSAPPTFMYINHSHPDPRTYVAYGRCGGSGCN